MPYDAVMVLLERSNGPRRLRDHDDAGDDDILGGDGDGDARAPHAHRPSRPRRRSTIVEVTAITSINTNDAEMH